MNVLTKKDLFSENILNIFTDASVTKVGKETISCPGTIALVGDTIVDKDYKILRSSTNNKGEITGILLGVFQAIKLRSIYSFDYINLYSDSLISINGLKEWIFNWLNNIQDNVMYGSSGPVKNQEIFLEVVNTILSNNLHICLYHVNGHHVTNNKESVYKFCASFKKNNSVKAKLSDDLVKELITCNNYIDNYTREILNNTDINKYGIYTKPITYLPYIDIDKYKELMYLT